MSRIATNAYPLTVYYDGTCPLCVAGGRAVDEIQPAGGISSTARPPAFPADRHRAKR